MTTHPAFVIRVDVKVILDTDWCSCALDGVKIVGYGQTDGQGVGLGIIPAPEVGQSFDASDPVESRDLKIQKVVGAVCSRPSFEEDASEMRVHLFVAG